MQEPHAKELRDAAKSCIRISIFNSRKSSDMARYRLYSSRQLPLPSSSLDLCRCANRAHDDAHELSILTGATPLLLVGHELHQLRELVC